MGAGAGVPLRELGLVLLVALSLAYLTTGVIRYLMVRSNWMTEIRDRDVHTIPKPRMGGVAMFTGFIGAVFLADQLPVEDGGGEGDADGDVGADAEAVHQLPALTRGFQPITPEMNAVVGGAVIIVMLGAIDDLWELDALTKIIGQLLGALIMSMLGLNWTLLYIPFGDGTTVLLDQFWSVVITVLFTVTLINAINFVDGLDGLAAGLGMIAGGSILLFSLTILHDQGGMVSAYPPAIIAAGLVGVCAGFLPHNFEPSRIFMGDSGSMLIGFLLAAASTSASGKINMGLYGAVDMVALLSPIIVVLAAVAIPLLDLVMAVVRRVRKGQSPFSADKKHLHHRLLTLGHSHRNVVLLLYTWVFVVAVGAVAYSMVPPLWATIGLVVALIFATLATRGPVKRARAELPPRPRRGISHRPHILHREKPPPEVSTAPEVPAAHEVVDSGVANHAVVAGETVNREVTRPSVTHRVANHDAPHYDKSNRNMPGGEETLDEAPETS